VVRESFEEVNFLLVGKNKVESEFREKYLETNDFRRFCGYRNFKPNLDGLKGLIRTASSVNLYPVTDCQFYLYFIVAIICLKIVHVYNY